MDRRLVTLLCWCVLLLAPAWASRSALAQTALWPSASAPFGPGLGGGETLCGHAWVALPMRASPQDPVDEAGLFHIPPRDSADRSPSGTIRLASRFKQMPEAIGAWGSRVFVVFPTERGTATASGKQRRVVSLTAVPTVPGLWDYFPQGGAQTLPLLPGEGRIASMVGTPHGPLVLIEGEADQPARAENTATSTPAPIPTPWRLLLLAGEGWVEVRFPAGWAGPSGQPGRVDWAALVSGRTGLGLVAHRTASGPVPAKLDLWRGDWSALNAGEGERPVVWPNQAARIDLPSALSSDSARWRVLWPDEQWALAAVGDDRVDLFSLAPQAQPGASAQGTPERAALPLAKMDKARPPMGVVSLDGLGRVLAVHEEPARPIAQTPATNPSAAPATPGVPGVSGTSSGPPGGGGLSPFALPTLAIHEVSVFTGAVFYSGRARSEGLLSARDFQVLTVLAGVVFLFVLLFVLKTDDAEPIALPMGMNLSTPVRRLVAAGLDAAVPVFVSCAIFSVAPESLLSWAMFSNRDEAIPALTAWALALAHCTLCEWATGMTLGKWLVGIRVVSVAKPGPARQREQPDTGDGQSEGDASADPSDELVPVHIDRATLGQVLVRNLVRWGMPPLTVLVLFDPNWRHPGDELAKTVVVDKRLDGTEDAG